MTSTNDDSRTQSVVEAGSASAATRILDTAEELFGRDGIGDVSLRSITRAAGTNSASIHYYFGSKEALIGAVVRRGMDELGRQRSFFVEGLAAAGQLDVRAIASGIVSPLAAMALDADHPRHHYPRFLAALQACGPDIRRLGGEAFRPWRQMLIEHLTRVLTDADARVVAFRLDLAAETVVRALADPERLRRPWSTDLDGAGNGFDNPVPIDQLINAIASLLDV